MTPVSSAKLHKKIFLTLAFVVFAFLVYPAAADYLGPDRTYTFYVSQRSTCSYLAVKPTGSCTLSLFAPPNNCPSTSSVAPFFNNDPQACGSLWGATCNGSNCTITLTGNSVSSCSMGETGCTNVEYTGSQSPATISGSVTCAGSTVNDWCTGSAQLSLSANEPVAGYAITLIEGTRNGESFACSSGATSCDVPLIEGQNDFTFWALSSWGDSSLMGTASGKVDTQSPSITGSLTGTGGDNGWYISDVILSASATDPTPGSGVDSFTYSLDRGAPVAFPGSLTLMDGVHTVVLQATDGAGHVVTLTRSASVDTVPPVSAFTIAVTDWVRGSVDLTGTSNDVTSGIAQVELSTDGGGTWQPLGGTTGWFYTWNTTTVADGAYTMLARAQDLAGNLESTASLTLNVDNTPPQAELDAPAAFCPGCGGTASLTYAVDDAASGLASWDLSVDGTSLVSGTTSVMDTLEWDGGGLSLGAHTLTLTGTDLAGNTTDVTVSINLDAAPPDESPAEKPSFLWFLATKTPTPLSTATQILSTPTATRTPVVETFGVIPPATPVEEPALPETGSPDPQAILWGAAAAGVIAAATAYSLEEKRKREEDEACQRAEMERENREARAHEMGFDSYADMVEKKEKAAFDAAWNQMLAQQAYLHWLHTGENPPPGYADVTAEERLEIYKQTDQYKKYQASLEAWGKKQAQENSAYNHWVRTGENPPPGYEDASEADRLQLYKLTPEYLNYQNSMIEMDRRKKLAEAAYLDWLRTGETPPPGFEDMTEAERLALYQRTSDYQQYQDQLASSEQNRITRWLQEKVQKPLEKLMNTKTPLEVLAITLVFGTSLMTLNNMIADPHALNAVRTNATDQSHQLFQMYPILQEDLNTKLLFSVTHPLEAINAGYEFTKFFADTIANYADTVWQYNPVAQVVSNGLTSLGDNCSENFGEANFRRCSAMFYYGASVVEHPLDTIVGVGTSLVADPLVGAIKVAAFSYEYNNLKFYTDLYYGIQENGLIDGYTDALGAMYDRMWTFVTTDQQVQTFGLLALFVVLALIPELSVLALAGGGALVLSQIADTLLKIDQALQLSPTRVDAMKVVTNSQTRRQVTTLLVALAIMIYAGARGLQELSRFNAFQESLTPAAQVSFSDLPLSRQLEIYRAVSDLNITPGALDFYLEHSAIGDARLAGLSLQDGLHIGMLAEQSGNGAFLLDFVVKYGYTDALRIASPEVIHGITNEQFLVRAQDILSNDAGYNVTPESVFTTYPGSTIGKNVTFITDETAISAIIGNFHGTEIIYISQEQAISLANSLGLDSQSLLYGFRISKISNLSSLDLSYPLEGSALFLGPGQGLPGGGTEMIINPSVPMDSLNVVDQIIIKVFP